MIVFRKFMRIGKFALSTVKHSTFEKIARFWRDPCPLLIALIAGLGTANILVRTAPYGAEIDMDATAFLSTALNFLAGEGLRDFTGQPLTLHPPLLPLLLAAGGWVGIEPLVAGRLIYAAAFGLIILAAGCWLRSNLRSRWLVLAATAIIAASEPLNYWAPRLRTDPLLVLLALLALIQLAAFLNRRTTASLWWAAVFTALAALTRYPGVALIAAGVLILLPLARLRHTLIFGAISSVPLLAVLARNWAATGDLTQATGDRTGYLSPSGQSLADGLRQIVNVFHEWTVLPNAPAGLTYLLWLAVATTVLASAVVVLRALRPDQKAAPAYFRLGPAIPFGGFVLTYLAFMVVVVPLTVEQVINTRYLLPIYVPLLLTAMFLLDRFLSIAASWTGAIRYSLAALVLLATLAHVGFSTQENLRRTAKVWSVGHEQDWMYNTPYWQQSETLNYIRSLRDNHVEGRVYSNKKSLAWFADGTVAPGKYLSIPREMGWPKIEAGAHIVWFDKFYHRSFLSYDDTDLRLLPGVETVAELADGVVFRRTAYEPFDAKRHRARKQRYMDQLIQQASERVVHAGWSVYRTGRKLTYLKEPCAPADVQAKFVLHVVPADPANLPAYCQQYISENLDFLFNWRGEQIDDQCIAIIPLPTYAIDHIYIGQWISKENRTVWEAELSPGR